MEGGEWRNFNAGVGVNEEADFMARLFSNPNAVKVHDYGNNQECNSSTYYRNLGKNVNGSSHYSSDSSSSNYYQQTSYKNTNVVGYYQTEYLNDNNNDHGLVAPTRNSAIDFLQCRMEDESNEVKAGNVGESVVDEDVKVKRSYSSENSKKRSKSLNVRTEKRNVIKAKKSHKLTLGCDDDDEEEENEGVYHRQGSISESLEDDCSSKGTGTTLNYSNGKGSAIDPQSLYARKRRERINERLKVLQTLIPNGTKVDISTMLEEAVNYVKFLQLQIKLLSSDEMWMYAPIAYNGMSLGLDLHNITIPR